MPQFQMTAEEEFQAEVNKIQAVMYILIDWGWEKGPPNSQLDQDDDDDENIKQKMGCIRIWFDFDLEPPCIMLIVWM